MAQLIVLLERHFKNTSETRPISNNIGLPDILKSRLQPGGKAVLKSFTKALKCGNGVVDTLSGDLVNCEFEMKNYRKRKVVKEIIKNELKKEKSDVEEERDVSEDNRDHEPSDNEGIESNPREKIATKTTQEEKSDSETDPFGADSDDDLDFNDGQNKKRKVISNSSNGRQRTNVKEENGTDSEFVPDDDDSEHEILTENDSDWEAEGSSPNKKRKKENSPKKSIVRDLIDNASYFICTLCEAEVKSSVEKQAHKKCHNLRYISYRKGYQCPKCDFQTTGSHQFRIHYQRHHSNVEGYFDWIKCTECPYKTTCDKYIIQHSKRHKEKAAFQCEYCSFSHDHKKNVTAHLRLHNKFLTAIFRCEKCSFSTKHYSGFFKHKRTHLLPEEQTNWRLCEECPFKTLEIANLRKHIKCHQLQDGYECPSCTYRSPYACRIKDHIKVHYGKDDQVPDYDPKRQTPLHSCPKCSYTTMTKAYIDRHMTTHQTYHNRRLNCGECPFACKDKIDLVSHMKYHNGEGPLKCPWCSFAHWAKQGLTRHKRLHGHVDSKLLKKRWRKGEPRCQVCHQLFQSLSHLKRHMSSHQTVDQVDDPVMCALCPYRSKNKGDSFITHVHCHFKSEGLKCNFCSFRHDRQNVMTTHLKLHKEESIKQEPGIEAPLFNGT